MVYIWVLWVEALKRCLAFCYINRWIVFGILISFPDITMMMALELRRLVAMMLHVTVGKPIARCVQRVQVFSNGSIAHDVWPAAHLVVFVCCLGFPPCHNSIDLVNRFLHMMPSLTFLIVLEGETHFDCTSIGRPMTSPNAADQLDDDAG